jgi:hypothetical protein
MSPVLLGLVGPSGAGKTIVTKHLAKKHQFAGVHAGFPVKDALAHGFGLSADQVHGPAKGEPAQELGGSTPKMVLDHVGEAIAKEAPQATSIVLRKKLREMAVNHPRVVVDGVRQQAEADTIRAHGGHIVRVNPTDPPNPKYPMDLRQAKIKADHEIPGGSKKQVKKHLDKLIEQLG